MVHTLLFYILETTLFVLILEMSFKTNFSNCVYLQESLFFRLYNKPVMESAIKIITNIAPQCQVKAVAVYGGFEPHFCQTKYYKIGISCFSAKHAAFGWGEVWRKIKVSWVQNQDNVSEWGDTSTCWLLSQRAHGLNTACYNITSCSSF
jgi:hypothetical protein